MDLWVVLRVIEEQIFVLCYLRLEYMQAYCRSAKRTTLFQDQKCERHAGVSSNNSTVRSILLCVYRYCTGGAPHRTVL